MFLKKYFVVTCSDEDEVVPYNRLGGYEPDDQRPLLRDGEDCVSRSLRRRPKHSKCGVQFDSVKYGLDGTITFQRSETQSEEEVAPKPSSVQQTPPYTIWSLVNPFLTLAKKKMGTSVAEGETEDSDTNDVANRGRARLRRCRPVGSSSLLRKAAGRFFK